MSNPTNEDIKDKLEKELEQIRYKHKLDNGLLLTETDIRSIFAILKENDQEVKPLLDVIEPLLLNLQEQNYLLIEKYITDILVFYNLLPNNDMMKCRHKLFFTESKKLTKKPFFGPTTVAKLKDELEVQNIFKKLLKG